MRLGCCLPLASFVPPTLDGQTRADAAAAATYAHIPGLLRVLEEAGGDFCELGVGLTLPEHQEPALDLLEHALAESALQPEAFNSFIPPSLPLCGDDVDWARVERYVDVATDRMARLGASVVVFGSGAARRCPDGFSPDEAAQQLRYFLGMAGTYCGQRGLKLCIEPLNATETNMVTTVAEAAALARELGHPGVFVLADLFHMGMEEEPLEHMVAAADLLGHTHIADKGRRVPAAHGYDINGFLGSLQKAGYQGRVSIEANFEDFALEAPQGLARLREALASPV